LHRFLVLVGTTVGSGIGWAVGSYFGFGTAFLLSMLGLLVGWIGAIKIRKAYGW
jgi:hypothetical protein